MKILVTGHRGFIGQHVVKVLEDQGHQSKGWDRAEGHELSYLAPAHFADIDAIIHLAAKADISQNWRSEKERRELLEDNIAGTWHLLEAMHGSCAHSIVFASTCAIYGSTRAHPACEITPPTPVTSPYAATKVAGEALVEAHCHAQTRNWYNARLVACVGSGYHHGHISDFVEMAKYGSIHAKDSGKYQKNYIHVRDAAEALVFMATHDVPSGTYNVASPDLWSWKDTVELMGESIAYDTIARDEGWIGDPVGLQVSTRKFDKYWQAHRAVRSGVREALEDLGWPTK